MSRDDTAQRRNPDLMTGVQHEGWGAEGAVWRAKAAILSWFLEQEALPEAEMQKDRPGAPLPGFVASSDTDYSSEVLVIRKGTGSTTEVSLPTSYCSSSN